MEPLRGAGERRFPASPLEAPEAGTDAPLALRVRTEVEGHNGAPPGAALAVGHVADYTRRYPGEHVTLLTRVDVRAAVEGFRLRVYVPAGLEIDHYQAAGHDWLPLIRLVEETPPHEMALLPGAGGSPFPLAAPGQPHRPLAPQRLGHELIWQVAEPQEAGARYEFETTALVLPAFEDVTLRSEAVVANLSSPALVVAAETTEIVVSVKGRYLEYLPALYEQDDFMGRFLMLFESFWRPISQQIDAIDHYFDPELTPARFLPWLAQWFDMTLDESWSEEQQRELLKNLIWFYRKRGTRVALQRYLEIYTCGQVEIVERRAKNFKLGSGGRLGAGVALGTGNVPHTFTVRLWLPPVAVPAHLSGAAAEAEAARLEKRRRQRIERLIEAEKPAHTSYQLEIEVAQRPARHAQNGEPSGSMPPAGAGIVGAD